MLTKKDKGGGKARSKSQLLRQPSTQVQKQEVALKESFLLLLAPPTFSVQRGRQR